MKRAGQWQLQQQQGFTLVELLVVVVLVAIMAAIAVPSYQNSVLKSKRTDGKLALSQAASLMEQYYLDNKTYTTDLTLLGYSSSPANSDEGHYQIKVEAATASCPIATCFLLSAAPQGKQTDDTCATLTLNSLGTQAPADCW